MLFLILHIHPALFEHVSIHSHPNCMTPSTVSPHYPLCLFDDS